MSKLGPPVSIRFTEGAPEKIRAITGRPVGELVRTWADAFIERHELEMQRAAVNAETSREQ